MACKINLNDSIYIAGHNGLLGSALLRVFKKNGYKNLIYEEKTKLNLFNQIETLNFIKFHNPDVVIMSSGVTGGIYENKTNPYNMISKNLVMQNNIFNAIEKINFKKLLFFGSSCMYPKIIERAIRASDLFSGQIETSSMAYALSKIAGFVQCKSYNDQFNTNKCITLIPNSIYGPNDNFDEKNGHVLASLISKFHNGIIKKKKIVNLWGDGTPLREFIYSDDVAFACKKILESDEIFVDPVNLGTGEEISIFELAKKIKNLTKFNGKIFFDKTKPNGTQRKLLDISKIISVGWQPKINLNMGLQKTYDWYLKNYKK